MAGIEKIDSILDNAEQEDPEVSQLPLTYDIEFSNVSFSYEEKRVLSNVSFVAKQGAITALVGPSGGGKSTIASLVARFWDINEGDIKIGGVPIRKIKIEDLMNIVSFVFQDNMLFFDTIESNIRLGNETATMDEVIEAANSAHCHEFITNLPNGYQTLIGEGGTYLSGGEQQRIAIARAILKNSPIILLDEATAYADPENEGKILESFSHLIRGKTVVIIAHRLNTIVNSNQILVVNNGTISERGNHMELVSMNGLFSTMWRVYNESRNWTLGNESE